MNFFDSLKSAFSTYKEKKNIGKKIIPYQHGIPQYMGENFRDLAEGGYLKNELVYACINAVATSAPEAPLKIIDDLGEHLNEHPIQQLIKKPNPFMSEFEFMEMIIIHLYLSGNVFIEKVRNKMGDVIELYLLRPDRIRIIPDEMEFIKGYIYELNGKQYELLKEDIIHIKLPNPMNEFFGAPPLRASMRAIATDNEMTDFQKVLLENRAIPGTIIKVTQEMDEATSNRMAKRWKQKFSGNNRGEPAIIHSDMDVDTVGMNMNELAFPDLRNISETRICSALGVPPIIVGANVGLQRSTFSNFEEARKSFWQDTISPLLKRVSDKINSELISEFKITNARAIFDKSKVTALQEQENEKWTRANTAFNGGFITINEARAEIGLDPIEKGDILFSETINQNSQIETQEKNKISSYKKEFKKKDKVEKNIFDKVDSAEEYHDLLKEMTQRHIKTIEKDTFKIISRKQKSLDDEDLSFLLGSLDKKSEEWEEELQETSEEVFELIAISAMTHAGEEILNQFGIEFSIDNEEAISFLKTYSFKFAEEFTETSRDKLKEIITTGYTEGASLTKIKHNLLINFEDWNKNRAELVARTETIRTSNKSAEFTYKQGGITLKKWNASTDACGFCSELNGSVIGIDENFYDLGEQIIQTRDGKKPAKLNINYEEISAPPLHPGCRCAISPYVDRSLFE